MQVYLIVSLIVAVLAVVFAVQNNAPVEVTFLAWKFSGSLALVILLAVAAGALTSLFASLPSILRITWHLRSHRKRLAELEAAAARQSPPPPPGRAPERPAPGTERRPAI